MTITTKITRADFVMQPNGSIAWACEVTLSAPSTDPFTGESKVETKVVGPMPPEKVLADYGLSLSDIVSGLDAQTVADLSTTQDAAKASAQAAAAQITDLENQIAALTAQVSALMPQVDPTA